MSVCADISLMSADKSLRDPAQTSPLALAYMGDCVYDLYVRTLLMQKGDYTARALHLQAAKLVCAPKQAEAYALAEPMLTEQEAAVFRRGRNAHMGTVSKNASIAQYRAATGLEAVIGYLYLRGDDARIREIMGIVLGLNEHREERI